MNNFTSLQEQFNNKQNLNLLWDVLLDEFHINNSNTNLLNNIKIVFESNINPFISRANPKSGIMELNKNFLSQVVLAVNRLFPHLKQEQNIKRITISNEEVTEPYKIEDIHSTRQNEFEKNVEQKRIDMENYLIPQKPKELDFSDKNLDGKITSMDSLIAEKMAQRNLEIEQLQNVNLNNNDMKNWLTPKETSLKNEKINFDENSIIKNNENARLKYMSIDSNNNITLSINESDKKSQHFAKKVSWNDDSLEQKEPPTINIFNKLKKQTILEKNYEAKNENYYNNVNNVNNVNNINNININEINDINNTKQYVEQKSIELPNVKQEEIIRNQSKIDPILPKSEIIKQMNETNKKIDNLYEMVSKLINLIEKNNKGGALQTETLTLEPVEKS